MKRKRVLVLCYSNLGSDPRVLRQISALSEKYTVYTAGMAASGLEDADKFVQIGHLYESGNPMLRFLIKCYRYFTIKFFNEFLHSHFLYYWDLSKLYDLFRLRKNNYDVIIANDIDTLPLAVNLSKSARVYFDAHEYAPLEYEDNARWLKYKSPFLLYLCKRYIPQTDYCTTVSNNLAAQYEQLTGREFDVVYNAPSYQSLPPSERSGTVIRCVHHGVASPIRKIESMITAFKELGESYELNLLLVKSDPKYYQEMITLAAGCENIIFHQPVPTGEIPRFINRFDVSLIFIPPVNFNYKYCLPNKFFESVQARLMLLCGPSPEMEILVNKYNLGAISTGFEADDIKNSLAEINKDIVEKYKKEADKNAEKLSAHLSMQLITKKIDALCAE